MTDIETDVHNSVGPTEDMYGHGPVTVIQERAVSDRSSDDGTTLFVCLDCGYTCHDNRMLAHEECERMENGITSTWREWFDKNDATDLPPPSDDEEWPIE